MGCEPNFDGQANSLWLYQNDIGATIYRGIHEQKAAQVGRLAGPARVLMVRRSGGVAHPVRYS